MPEFAFVDEKFVPKTRTTATGPRGPRERLASQVPWDEAFETAMNGKGYLAVQILPDDAEDAKKRILSSARLFEMATTEGEPQPGRVKGTVILSWMIRVPKKRGPRIKKTDVTVDEESYEDETSE